MAAPKQTQLKRSLTLTLVSLYGLGNILGAGIYVLIGKVAAEAGYLAPLAFLLASMVAAITAFSFAELSSRFPLSGGGALYVHKGFGLPQVTVIVGLMIILTGIVSAATIAKGFVGYLQVFIAVNDWLVIISLLTMLCFLACWGITESVSTAVVITFVEVLGLVLILAVSVPATGAGALPSLEVPDPAPAVAWTGLVGGSFLAFYAYVGFEDMVNVAEEVRHPTRNMPLAILFALVVATVLYMLVAVSALLILTPEQLGASDAPLATVYETATGNSPWAISIISMFAVVNGALIQIIMGSRVCYGLAREKLLPEFIGQVNSRTRTPINATIVITAIIIAAALWFPIETLARSTTALLLLVFSLVNVALLRIKLRENHPQGVFAVPLFVPVLGALLCVSFLAAESYSLFRG